MSKAIYELFAAGKTYTQISDICGITKNQVAGIIFRYRKKHAIPPKASPIVKKKFKPSKFLPSFIEVLTHDTCRFIDGVDDQRVYCGHERKPGSPYCEGHSRICYRRLA